MNIAQGTVGAEKEKQKTENSYNRATSPYNRAAIQSSYAEKDNQAYADKDDQKYIINLIKKVEPLYYQNKYSIFKFTIIDHS